MGFQYVLGTPRFDIVPHNLPQIPSLQPQLLIRELPKQPIPPTSPIRKRDHQQRLHKRGHRGTVRHLVVAHLGQRRRGRVLHGKFRARLLFEQLQQLVLRHAVLDDLEEAVGCLLLVLRSEDCQRGLHNEGYRAGGDGLVARVEDVGGFGGEVEAVGAVLEALGSVSVREPMERKR